MRARTLVPLLILLIVLPFLVYAWIAIAAARDIAREEALVRNRATAQLGGRLVGKQNGDAVNYLRAAARQSGLRRAMQSRNLVALRRLLAETRLLNDEFASVAAYAPRGPLLASSPPTASQTLPPTATAGDYLMIASGGQVAESGASHGGDPSGGLVVHLAVPILEHQAVVGVMTAALRLQVIREWLEPVNLGPGGLIDVVDSRGFLVATSRGARAAAQDVSSLEAVRRVLRGEEGGGELQMTVAGEPALVGYEPIRRTGWGVIAVQPTRAAYARADRLAQHLALLLVPVVAIAIGIGILLRTLFDRQAELARGNALLSKHLREQNERLREADRLKSDFLANVSHDLRTPLASIKASISGLLEPDIEWDRVSLRGFLDVVNEETDRLTRRVRNLLDMTRLEAHALPLEKDLCDLTDIVSAALERLVPLLRGRPLEDHFPSEPLYVQADYAQVEMVIVNLIENALKYSPPGTPLVISGRRVEAEVEIAVRDRGAGVPPGDEERIFEKFYRAAGGRQQAGGTGLGLAICKAVVEAHEGKIGVRRPQEGGAEFWFHLPLTRTLAEDRCEGRVGAG
jgi:signal transduction histidine kinase